MFEEQPKTLQQKVKLLATEALQKSEHSAWFDVLYSQANKDASQVPWAKLTAHPYLQDWLNDQIIQGQGKSALVIGCGLGDDAETLADLGFQVTAFDISPTAIAWAKERFPNSPVNYVVADLLALNPDWQGKFDFVFECRNIQALPLNIREKVINAITPLVAPGGTLLVITRIRDFDAQPDGPPWPLSETELAQFQKFGLSEISRHTFIESEHHQVEQVRIEYKLNVES
ncbi:MULTISPECIES: bifunctional 2-polyprenyl-6-hydroxyphenol methylase/3-demethylubiquinol 3-O-methyltransferase UbiG [Planktothricoides]|uniref:Class I SAM-dependent methyltransferase n=1 Tax=Planktothricoides raciborskii GIHE-MW2 TaxID=2792601 RepID=A0AAU8JHR1_9CYAN|nr:class I SAM-dependent methyltransferase [Planktothricoides sp. SR001]KOR35077.1 thiopurine S-methyltransferase [Planktothricoides sp. SR001]